MGFVSIEENLFCRALGGRQNLFALGGVDGGLNPRDSGRHGRQAPCRSGVTAP